MPTREHQPTTEQPPIEGAGPEPDHDIVEQEQRYKTIAVRVEEQLHAQLQFIAHLGKTSISDEIRRAIEGRISDAQHDPELIARAQQAREQIEREAAARSAALNGFIGANAVNTASRASRSRQTIKPAGE